MVKMKIMKISKTLQLVEVGVSLQSCLGTSPHTSLDSSMLLNKFKQNYRKKSSLNNLPG